MDNNLPIKHGSSEITLATLASTSMTINNSTYTLYTATHTSELVRTNLARGGVDTAPNCTFYKNDTSIASGTTVVPQYGTDYMDIQLIKGDILKLSKSSGSNFTLTYTVIGGYID